MQRKEENWAKTNKSINTDVLYFLSKLFCRDLREREGTIKFYEESLFERTNALGQIICFNVRCFLSVFLSLSLLIK